MVATGIALSPHIAMAATCPAGQWLHSSGQCAKCNLSGPSGLVSTVANTYCPGDDTRHNCKDERPNSGTFNPSVSYTSLDDCLCLNGYEFGSDGYCHACPKGTYKQETSNTSVCKIVPAGNYACESRNMMCDWYEYCDMDSAARDACPCDVGYFCPEGSAEPTKCPNGKTTSSNGAKSAAECNICGRGYGGSSCTECSRGYYKSSTGTDACSPCSGRTKYASGTAATSCSTVSTGYYTTGCNGNGDACTGQSVCGTGYYCTGGIQYSCGEHATTNKTNATSINDCICLDGYEKQEDGTCAEPAPKQTVCGVGVSQLRVGDLSYPLWENCESPALWIGTEKGNCCVNLTPGQANGALNINYGGNTYHTVD